MPAALMRFLPSKRSIYLLLAMLLFVLLSFIAFDLLAKAWPEYFLQWAGKGCILEGLNLLFLALSLLGAIVGYYVGGRWWRMI
jgi:hypothetical protein